LKIKREENMLKKWFFVLLICIMALPCLFAGQRGSNVIDLSMTPSSYQIIKVGDDTYEAASGLAASAGYMRSFKNGLSAGGSIEWSNYKQEKLLPYGSFNNIAILARGNYRFALSERVFAETGLGLGYEMCVVGKNVTNSFVAEINGDFGIIIDDVFSLLAGAKAKIAVQKTTNVYSVLPFIGAGISF